MKSETNKTKKQVDQARYQIQYTSSLISWDFNFEFFCFILDWPHQPIDFKSEISSFIRLVSHLHTDHS